MEVVYRSASLEVRYVPGSREGAVVVVFDAYSHDRDLSRPSWGQEFFTRRGVSAVYVLGVNNDWYQYPDIEDALAAVRSVTDPVDRVLVYGYSMGAYAAVRFSPEVSGDLAIVVAPQYSICPSVAPFEHRWMPDVARIQFSPNLNGPIESRVPTYMVFDPSSIDGVHARMIMGDIPARAIRMRYTGHSVPVILTDTGLLQRMVEEGLTGEIDTRSHERAFRAARRKSAVYIAELADHQPAHRSETAIALARRAAALEPLHDYPALTLGKLLADKGCHSEAIEWFEQILSRGGNHLAVLLFISVSLWETGRVDEALVFSERLARMFPEHAGGRHWHAVLLWRTGDPAAALGHAAAAVGLDPRNRGYAAQLEEIQLRLNPRPIRKFRSRLRPVVRRLVKMLNTVRRSITARS